MKNGFTLVELSIVLVIIGLLIGGLLVGQSLIDSAKVNATASQIQQFDAGVMAFKAKYKYLPGDAPGFGGNGNEIVFTFNGVFSGEIANFWNNLDSVKFPGTSAYDTIGIPVVLTGSNANVPKSKLGKSDSFFLASTRSGNTSGASPTPSIRNLTYYTIITKDSVSNAGSGRWAFLTTDNDYSTDQPSRAAVKPADLLALDQKIDDSVANSGAVVSGVITSTSCGSDRCGFPFPKNLSSCVTAGAYNLTNSDYGCTPMIRIGGQAGNPL